VESDGGRDGEGKEGWRGNIYISTDKIKFVQ
jgi:hypothetical protein